MPTFPALGIGHDTTQPRAPGPSSGISSAGGPPSPNSISSPLVIMRSRDRRLAAMPGYRPGTTTFQRVECRGGLRPNKEKPDVFVVAIRFRAIGPFAKFRLVEQARWMRVAGTPPRLSISRLEAESKCVPSSHLRYLLQLPC